MECSHQSSPILTSTFNDIHNIQIQHLVFVEGISCAFTETEVYELTSTGNIHGRK